MMNEIMSHNIAVTRMGEPSLPPLVMLHGWGLHSGVWLKVEAALAEHFHLHLIDLPGFGDATSPANTGVGVEFLERTYPEIAIPNVVTAVLASYRGFDTLGEVGVVFAAGLAVTLLLGFGERSLGATVRREDRESPAKKDEAES